MTTLAFVHEKTLMKIADPQIDQPLGSRLLNFRFGFFQHLRCIVDADEVDAFVQKGIEHQQRGRGRAADIIEIGIGPGEIPRQLADHALHFFIKGHRPAYHVIENTGDRGIEGKVPYGLVLAEEHIVLAFNVEHFAQVFCRHLV